MDLRFTCEALAKRLARTEVFAAMAFGACVGED